MRAVLDTNVVMSAIFFGGVPFEVLNAWHNGEFELVVSDAVMAEYREIAVRMKVKFPLIEPERWLRLFGRQAPVGLQRMEWHRSVDPALVLQSTAWSVTNAPCRAALVPGAAIFCCQKC